MPVIRVTTRISAPVARCFDLARSIDLHLHSTHGTDEEAVGGVTSGLIGAGEEVTWRARHLGVRQHLTSRITAFDRPRHFRDSQIKGIFARLDHDHYFAPEGDGTRMTDVMDFAAPLGPLGRLAEWLFLTAYLRRFLDERNHILKAVAEGNEWQTYLDAGEGTNP